MARRYEGHTGLPTTGSLSERKLVSDDTFNILKAAVNIARNEQVRRLATLRAKLSAIFPGKDEQITEAINAWAEHARANR